LPNGSAEADPFQCKFAMHTAPARRQPLRDNRFAK